MHNFIDPNKQVLSPTGASIRPKIIERQFDGATHKEAHYYDPFNGTFLHKGTVSITYPDGTVKDIKSPF